jgi:TLC ATP/ADP transporter
VRCCSELIVEARCFGADSSLSSILQLDIARPRAGGSKGDKKEKKKNMGVGESFAFLARSTYIRCIATLVVSYGIAINIVEACAPLRLYLFPIIWQSTQRS